MDGCPNFMKPGYGSNLCGAFVVAWIISILNNIPPSRVLFDQSKMRQHFVRIIDTGVVSMFPHQTMPDPAAGAVGGAGGGNRAGFVGNGTG